MRIAFFADNFYPELSGIADSILITGRELERRGHDVVYVGPYYADREYTMVGRTRDHNGAQEVVHGMPAVRLPSVRLPYSPTGQSRLAFPTGASFGYLDKHRPDIIHTHSPYGTGFEALRAAKRYRVPLVGTNHTAVEDFYPFAPELMRRFDAWYYNHCDIITTPYQELIDRMRQKGFTKPAKRQPNPVVLSLFTPPSDSERAALRQQFGLTGPTLLYAGRLAVEKRIDVVLRALPPLCAQHPDLTCVVIGSGAERKNLEQLAASLGIGQNVRFTGFVPAETLARYYKAADVFVLMSTSDSQSLSLMQAHATGLPSVGANSKGLLEYIPPETGYLVEPGDTRALTKTLELLLGDPALRACLGAAGTRFVAQFAPETIAAEWEQLYVNISKKA